MIMKRLAAVLAAILLMLLAVVPAAAETVSSGTQKIIPGHWEKTEELFLPSASQESRKFKVSYRDFSDSYPAGGYCRPALTVTCYKGADDVSGSLTGSVCFADVKTGDDAFGQQVTVREYFEKRRSASRAPFLMQNFGTGAEQGISGSAESASGTKEYYYDPCCRFPRAAADGEEISVVLDISDQTGEDAGIRYIWKYTFRADPETAEGISGEKQEEESHPEDSVEWIKSVYPGHWDLTGISFTGGNKETEDAGGNRIITGRTGVDGQNMTYTFEGKGEPFIITIPDEQFEDRYYAGDSFFTELEIFCSSDTEKTPGYVICSLALCDVVFGEGKYGVKITPKKWLTAGYPAKNVETFGPLPHNDTMRWRKDLKRGYLWLDGEFPEGSADGEKIWLVYGVMDSEGKENRMYNIREYTWTAGPDVVWTYNPPMY